ncbi:hypothetical protein [Rhodococcus qingshengii]
MKTFVGVLAVSALLLAGCGSGDDESRADVTPTTTSAAVVEVLMPSDVADYREQLFEQYAPCESGPTLAECAPAIDDMTETLTEFGARVPVSMPKTKASVTETVANLEYWRDNCIIGSSGTGDRAKCVKAMPASEIVQDPIWEWLDENRK